MATLDIVNVNCPCCTRSFDVCSCDVDECECMENEGVDETEDEN